MCCGIIVMFSLVWRTNNKFKFEFYIVNNNVVWCYERNNKIDKN